MNVTIDIDGQRSGGGLIVTNWVWNPLGKYTAIAIDKHSCIDSKKYTSHSNYRIS